MADERLIGELLVQKGVVSRAAVEEASVAAQAAGVRLCSHLLFAGACDQRDLASALAARHGLPGIDLSRSVLDLRSLDLIPRTVAEADLILPLSTEGDRIHLAVDSPVRAEQVVAEVRFVTGREVSVYVAVLGALQQAISAAYDSREKGQASWRGAAAGSGPGRLEILLPEPLPEVELGEVDVLIVDATDEVEADPPASGAGPPRILAVDDEPAIRLLVQRALQHKGYEVHTAADGQEALDLVRARPPDLLLLDAMLPKVHGFEVARRVRSDPATRQVPIIIMTAVYRGWRFAQDARETYGAEDYVEKPFRVDDLLRRVGAVLESTSSRELAAREVENPALVRAREILGAGQVDAAIGALEEAIRLDPFSAEAHFLLGKALRVRGDAFRAMTALERAVELRPALLPALQALTATYLERGFRAKAAETLERAVRAAPDGPTRQALRTELLKLL